MSDATRLDRSFAIIEVIDQPGPDADRWQAIMEQLDGLQLTDASDDVRAAIENFGVACNTILSPHGDAPEDCDSRVDEPDAAKLVAFSLEMAGLIRHAESDRLMGRLRHHGAVFPEEAILAARRHHGWFTPLLLQECQSLVESAEKRSGDPEPENANQYNSIPFFSMFLFSEWEVAESVSIMLRALHLPGEIPFELFGDAVHELIPRYLAQFLSDDLDRIDELIGDPAAHPYVRWAAASSYRYLVRDRSVPVQTAVSRLDRLYEKTKIAQADGRPAIGHCYEVTSGIVNVIGSIGGGTHSMFSRHGSDWDFIDESLVDVEELFGTSTGNDPLELPSELHRLPPTSVQDSIADLRHWAAFNSTPKRPSSQPHSPPRPIMERTASFTSPPPQPTPVKKATRVPRNAKCPCGSGRKYKQCCFRTNLASQI